MGDNNGFDPVASNSKGGVLIASGSARFLLLVELASTIFLMLSYHLVQGRYVTNQTIWILP